MPTSQPITSLWTPAEVTSFAWTLVGVFSGIFTALGYLFVKIIDAKTNAKLRILAAESQSRVAEVKGAADQLSKQVNGMQTQITVAAAMAPPPTTSPVTPVEFPGSPR